MLIAGVVMIGGVYIQGDRTEFLVITAVVALLVNYTVALRYFVMRRSDETVWFQLGVYLLAPVAGAWRFLVLRPLMLFAYLTFWKVDSWGTGETVEAADVAGPVDELAVAR